MTTPEHAAHQLHDLNTWTRLLPHTPTTRTHSLIHTHKTRHQRRDLADLLTHNTPTPPHITTWATHWATAANLPTDKNPLLTLATNTHHLAEQWAHWDTFTHDLHTLHTRIAHITGHAPRTIGPCPTCNQPMQQAQTRHGAEGPLECERGHTYPTVSAYHNALRETHQHTLQNITNPTIEVTARQFLHAWPTITRDDIKNWTRTGRLTLTHTRPHTFSLAVANTLARQLLSKRARNH